ASSVMLLSAPNMNCADDWAGYYQAALPNSSQFYPVSGRIFFFTVPATSDYQLSEQAIHHEIEWFFVTTFNSIGISPYRGTAVGLCRAVFGRLLRRNVGCDRKDR